MSGSYIDHIIWGEFWGGDQTGIYKYWRALKSADPPQYLGPPISAETQVTDGVVQQAFASGAVIQWSAEGGAELANDP
ncbi:MAG: hypothetical protein J2P17_25225 [Mycobacterium sp.]|nr:hypothetical protein [Mycobacterium sp.]